MNDNTENASDLALPTTPEQRRSDGIALSQGMPPAQLREVPVGATVLQPGQPLASVPQPGELHPSQVGMPNGWPAGVVMPNITIVNNNTAQTGGGLLGANQKSLGLALVLTFFFGPLGMLYSTVLGAVVTFIIGFIGLLLTGGFIFLILWPIQLIWTYAGVKKHNARVYLRAA
ncbi:hypothetical protein MF271_00720 (plasmid) [Deinococcus sp. KNUC1210]|uniref:hypothetical protein n=1 Tax=Deinococcus sp. KNUC1210 TaxID=2917691 RepID=UPI001EF0BFC1|nr:hypothetical protein [Deinococcus sp. KNUC1210]ULH14035.1 hypothetical protein MF271_00720 [Deinococcus sp. KNUC1210]